MRRRSVPWVLALAALGLAACGSESPKAQSAAPPAARAAAPAAAKESAPAQEILTVLSVEHEVDVLAERDGVVVEILQDEGARVSQGTVLARLDDRELLAQLDRARAEVSAQENDVKFNEAERKATAAAYRRAQEMFRERLSSEAELEEAEFRAKGSEHDLAASQARLEKARAEVRVLELELERTRLRAPFAGVVARRYLRAGQNVLKDEKVFRVSELSPLRVKFLVPETAARRPRAGETVNVVPVSDSQRVYPARITMVSPTVDPASGSYDVTARLTGTDLRELRPGMSVKVLWGTAAPSPGGTR
jgi:RND family efflux transporter MFP subunit